MNSPEYYEIAAGYACYRPAGQVSLKEAIELVSRAIAFSRDHQIGKLLVDTTKLTGFGPPGTWARFRIARQLAFESRKLVTVVLIARAEMIDPQRFGFSVASNLGMSGEIFSSEAEAVAWLMMPKIRRDFALCRLTEKG